MNGTRQAVARGGFCGGEAARTLSPHQRVDALVQFIMNCWNERDADVSGSERRQRGDGRRLRWWPLSTRGDAILVGWHVTSI